MGYLKCCFILLLLCHDKVCHSSEVKIGVLLPKKSHYPWSISQVLPAVELALERVNQNILPNTRLEILVADSDCSETKGPLEAMKQYQKGANIFLGPVCNYAVAPVARYSPYWNVPIITAGASAGSFADKSVYQLLTRIHETTSSTAESVIHFTKAFNWTQIGLIYENEILSSNAWQSECFFTMQSIHKQVKNIYGISPPYQKIVKDSDMKHILQTASLKAKVFVLCGSPDTVRDLMVTEHELGMDRGQFVFLNINIVSRSDQEADMPWYRQGDTHERNNMARKAYEVLMTITVKEPSKLEYTTFSNEVKRRGKNMYPDVRYKPGNVNGIVGAFHDAVFLYALALNETIEAGESITNGTAVTRRMWNRTFDGVTGTVAIDENGDRLMDYSLLNMDPQTGRYQVVANYFANSKQVERVPGRDIHFGVDNNSHKKDFAPCDPEDSECSDKGVKPDKQHKVEAMLEDLKISLAKISTAVEEHKTKLGAVTKVMKEDQST